jgi:hypothetical protein
VMGMSLAASALLISAMAENATALRV